MEQVKKKLVNPYVAPGIQRMCITHKEITILIKEHGVPWVMTKIMEIVCAVTEVKVSDVSSKKRYRPIATARHLVRFYMWETLQSVVSQAEMSSFITNGRNEDHTMIVHSRAIIENSLDIRDPWSASIIAYIYQIDSQLKQLTQDESYSSNGTGR